MGGRSAGHEILRFAATFTNPSIRNRILAAEEAMDFYQQYCSDNPGFIISVADFFLKIATQLEKSNSNTRLKAVTDILHARFLAISIMLNDTFVDEERNQMLDCWQKVTYRIFGLCGKDSRTKVGDYTRLAQRIYSNRVSKDHVAEQVTSLGKDHTIDEGIRRLSTIDCYNEWSHDDLLYFFYRYEEYLTENAGAEISHEVWQSIWSESPPKSIEHIFPQTPGPDWQGKLGKGETVGKNVHRLGNLMYYLLE